MNLKLTSALVLFFLLAPVWAGGIEGNVYLSEELTPHVLVFVVGTEGMASQSHTTVQLDHSEGDFVPHVLPIQAGSTVEFRTSDGMPCRLYSASEAGLFNLMRQSGPNRALTFDHPGVIVVRCQDHPSAYAYIVVVETPYFAMTNEVGHYSISDIPEGEYTAQIWFEGRVLEEKKVRSGTGDTSLDFHIDRPWNTSPSIKEGQPKEGISKENKEE
ncbi:hypothetical protein MYX82_07410 [Acidobacteria bacterium AH-259-D05]|nr:hypothetical protein [Acidobacteria bacterium AH-259-D05]